MHRQIIAVVAVSLFVAFGTHALRAQQASQKMGSGGAPEKAQICLACHGENGIPADKAIPILFGQNEGYIYTELKDMKKGARQNEQMAPIVADLTRDDMLALAAYFSSLKWPNLKQPRASAEDDRKFEAINASAGCTGCHQAGYVGAGTQPHVAGQGYDYLLKTMMDFRSGARANNAWMKDLLNTYHDEDIQLMARTLAGM